jgi:hypothetical protein
MEISFVKKKEGKHIISCRRKGGTETWTHITPFFVLHDLCHYAVETNLKMKSAFYGMLAAGTSISDFELPKEQRPFELTDEALLAEHLVNLLTIEHSQGKLNNFTEMFSASYKRPGEDFLSMLKHGKLEEIRKDFQQLADRWNALEEESVLKLDFE